MMTLNDSAQELELSSEEVLLRFQNGRKNEIFYPVQHSVDLMEGPANDISRHSRKKWRSRRANRMRDDSVDVETEVSHPVQHPSMFSTFEYDSMSPLDRRPNSSCSDEGFCEDETNKYDEIISGEAETEELLPGQHLLKLIAPEYDPMPDQRPEEPPLEMSYSTEDTNRLAERIYKEAGNIGISTKNVLRQGSNSRKVDIQRNMSIETRTRGVPPDPVQHHVKHFATVTRVTKSVQQPFEVLGPMMSTTDEHIDIITITDDETDLFAGTLPMPTEGPVQKSLSASTDIFSQPEYYERCYPCEIPDIEDFIIEQSKEESHIPPAIETTSSFCNDQQVPELHGCVFKNDFFPVEHIPFGQALLSPPESAKVSWPCNTTMEDNEIPQRVKDVVEALATKNQISTTEQEDSNVLAVKNNTVVNALLQSEPSVFTDTPLRPTTSFLDRSSYKDLMAISKKATPTLIEIKKIVDLALDELFGKNNKKLVKGVDICSLQQENDILQTPGNVKKKEAADADSLVNKSLLRSYSKFDATTIASIDPIATAAATVEKSSSLYNLTTVGDFGTASEIDQVTSKEIQQKTLPAVISCPSGNWVKFPKVRKPKDTSEERLQTEKNVLQILRNAREKIAAAAGSLVETTPLRSPLKSDATLITSTDPTATAAATVEKASSLDNLTTVGDFGTASKIDLVTSKEIQQNTDETMEKAKHDLTEIYTKTKEGELLPAIKENVATCSPKILMEVMNKTTEVSSALPAVISHLGGNGAKFLKIKKPKDTLEERLQTEKNVLQILRNAREKIAAAAGSLVETTPLRSPLKSDATLITSTDPTATAAATVEKASSLDNLTTVGDFGTASKIDLVTSKEIQQNTDETMEKAKHDLTEIYTKTKEGELLPAIKENVATCSPKILMEVMNKTTEVSSALPAVISHLGGNGAKFLKIKKPKDTLEERLQTEKNVLQILRNAREKIAAAAGSLVKTTPLRSSLKSDATLITSTDPTAIAAATVEKASSLDNLTTVGDLGTASEIDLVTSKEVQQNTDEMMEKAKHDLTEIYTRTKEGELLPAIKENVVTCSPMILTEVMDKRTEVSPALPAVISHLSGNGTDIPKVKKPKDTLEERLQTEKNVLQILKSASTPVENLFLSPDSSPGGILGTTSKVKSMEVGEKKGGNRGRNLKKFYLTDVTPDEAEQEAELNKKAKQNVIEIFEKIKEKEISRVVKDVVATCLRRVQAMEERNAIPEFNTSSLIKTAPHPSETTRTETTSQLKKQLKKMLPPAEMMENAKHDLTEFCTKTKEGELLTAIEDDVATCSPKILTEVMNKRTEVSSALPAVISRPCGNGAKFLKVRKPKDTLEEKLQTEKNVLQILSNAREKIAAGADSLVKESPLPSSLKSDATLITSTDPTATAAATVEKSSSLDNLITVGDLVKASEVHQVTSKETQEAEKEAELNKKAKQNVIEIFEKIKEKEISRVVKDVVATCLRRVQAMEERHAIPEFNTSSLIKTTPHPSETTRTETASTCATSLFGDSPGKGLKVELSKTAMKDVHQMKEDMVQVLRNIRKRKASEADTYSPKIQVKGLSRAEVIEEGSAIPVVSMTKTSSQHSLKSKFVETTLTEVAKTCTLPLSVDKENVQKTVEIVPKIKPSSLPTTATCQPVALKKSSKPKQVPQQRKTFPDNVIKSAKMQYDPKAFAKAPICKFALKHQLTPKWGRQKQPSPKFYDDSDFAARTKPQGQQSVSLKRSKEVQATDKVTPIGKTMHLSTSETEPVSLVSAPETAFPVSVTVPLPNHLNDGPDQPSNQANQKIQKKHLENPQIINPSHCMEFRENIFEPIALTQCANASDVAAEAEGNAESHLKQSVFSENLQYFNQNISKNHLSTQTLSALSHILKRKADTEDSNLATPKFQRSEKEKCVLAILGQFDREM